MAISYHVFGPCVLFTGTGSADALEAVGVSAEPGRIEIVNYHEERKNDGAGRAPGDIQSMGQEAFIDITLCSWDDAILKKAIQRSQGAAGSTTDGVGAAPGVLLGTGGFAFAVNLPSTTDLPWTFPTCILLNPNRTPGTKSDDYRLRFRAWRLVLGAESSSATKALYSRS